MKHISIFYLKLLLIAYSCTSTGNKTATTTPGDTIITSTPIKTDTAVAFMEMKKYLPVSVPGYKTEGYPDVNDNFTGEPTGETNSTRTSNGRASFIKHLYKKGDSEIAVEIIDYIASPHVYKDLIRMFDPTIAKDNEMETKTPFDTGLHSVIAQEVQSKQEHKAVLHVFICDRFVINIQTLNTGKTNLLKETLEKFKLEELMGDYCSSKQQ